MMSRVEERSPATSMTEIVIGPSASPPCGARPTTVSPTRARDDSAIRRNDRWLMALLRPGPYGTAPWGVNARAQRLCPTEACAVGALYRVTGRAVLGQINFVILRIGRFGIPLAE